MTAEERITLLEQELVRLKSIVETADDEEVMHTARYDEVMEALTERILTTDNDVWMNADTHDQVVAFVRERENTIIRLYEQQRLLLENIKILRNALMPLAAAIKNFPRADKQLHLFMGQADSDRVRFRLHHNSQPLTAETLWEAHKALADIKENP